MHVRHKTIALSIIKLALSFFSVIVITFSWWLMLWLAILDNTRMLPTFSWDHCLSSDLRRRNSTSVSKAACIKRMVDSPLDEILLSNDPGMTTLADGSTISSVSETWSLFSLSAYLTLSIEFLMTLPENLKPRATTTNCLFSRTVAPPALTG